MKKSEFKQLIKECIQEVIGDLSQLTDMERYVLKTYITYPRQLQIPAKKKEFRTAGLYDSVSEKIDPRLLQATNGLKAKGLVFNVYSPFNLELNFQKISSLVPDIGDLELDLLRKNAGLSITE